MSNYAVAREAIKRGATPKPKLRPQTIKDWKGPFPLPSEVERYFKELGPVDIQLSGVANNFFLPRLAGLWEYQAGYRYHPETKERFPGWDDDWLVIADEGSDPCIISRKTGRILQAMHGTGSWKFTEVSPDLETFITTLATLAEVVAAHPDEDEDYDDWLKILKKAALPKLKKLYGAKAAKDLLATFWGKD